MQKLLFCLKELTQKRVHIFKTTFYATTYNFEIIYNHSQQKRYCSIRIDKTLKLILRCTRVAVNMPHGLVMHYCIILKLIMYKYDTFMTIYIYISTVIIVYNYTYLSSSTHTATYSYIYYLQDIKVKNF